MRPELLDSLIKYVGALVQAGLAVLLVKFIPNQPELIAFVLSTTGTAYGSLAFNTPLNAVRKANGLVSVRAPSDADAELMRAAVARVDSVKPPAGGA